jgi:hypothetical protein
MPVSAADAARQALKEEAYAACIKIIWLAV